MLQKNINFGNFYKPDKCVNEKNNYGEFHAIQSGGRMKFIDENNLLLTPNSTLSPYSKVDTANGMPINGPRIVNSVNNNLRSKEYAEKENLKNLYSRNIAPSIAYDTEKFLKAKNLLSPIFNHNEAITKYDMISKLENKNKDFQSQINILA